MSRSRYLPLIGLALHGCGASSTSAHQAALDGQVTYFHQAFGAGPLLYTNASGAVVEERRYEPFGAAIDAGDVRARDLNELDKRTDASTAWSDHGARWMQPELARWTSTDPPVEGPDDKFMSMPWGLHPYQYVNQNPVAYWDPDGREPATLDTRKQGMFGYATVDPVPGSKPSDFHFGFALFQSIKDGTMLQFMQGEVHQGTWINTSGDVTKGIDVQGNSLKFTIAPGGELGDHIGLDVAVGTGEAGAYCTTNAGSFDCTVGAEANAFAIGGTYQDGDESARLGWAASAGMMFRGGFKLGPDGKINSIHSGYDLGPVMVDVNLTPSHWAAIMHWALPVGEKVMNELGSATIREPKK